VALVSEAADLASCAAAISGRLQRSSSSIQGPARIDSAAAAFYSLEAIKLPEATRGFVLLPLRWVIDRSFAWTARFRGCASDYERPRETVEGPHVLAFSCLMLRQLFNAVTQRPQHALVSKHANVEEPG
jgi:hypothetical protein